MPVEVWYIVALLIAICITFLFLKRPIYECMLYGYVFMLILTGEYRNFWVYIEKTSTDTLFYAIIAFLALARILDATHAIDSVVNIIISVFGRFKGGAVYTAVIGSTFMGALSGSGAGNVAATGVFTIPAMKKTGVPAYLAANIPLQAHSDIFLLDNVVNTGFTFARARQALRKYIKIEPSLLAISATSNWLN